MQRGSRGPKGSKVGPRIPKGVLGVQRGCKGSAKGIQTGPGFKGGSKVGPKLILGVTCHPLTEKLFRVFFVNLNH